MPVIPDLKFAEGEWKPAAPDTRAAMAPGLALAGLGETISETGGYLSKVGERIQQIRSEDAVVKLRTSMMNAEAEHEKFRIQNPDPATWAPDIAKRTQAVSDQFKDLKLSANARSQFDDTYSTWATQTRNSTEVDALKYEVTRARQNISNLDLKYRQNGKFAAARQLQDKAVEVGTYTPEEGQANRDDIDREEHENAKKADVSKYRTIIEDSPQEALDFLSEKNPDGSWKNHTDMEEGARSLLLNYGESKLIQKKSFELESYRGAIDKGLVTEKEILDLSLDLGNKEKKSLLSYYRRITPPSQDEEMNLWKSVGDIRNLHTQAKNGQIDESTYRKAHHEAEVLATENLSPGYKGSLLQSLQLYTPDRLYKEKTISNFSEIEKRQDIAVELRGILQKAYDTHLFGRVDATPLEQGYAVAKISELQNQAMSWLEGRKTVEADDAREYVDKLISTQRAATAPRARTTVPGTGTTLSTKPLPYLGSQRRPAVSPSTTSESANENAYAKRLKQYLGQ